MKLLMSTTLSILAFAIIASPIRSSIASKEAFAHTEGIKEYSVMDYRQDGLIALYDGIDNTGVGEHDSNSLVWKDLVGDLDISLSDAQEFSDNSLVCTDENVPPKGLFADFGSYSGFTIEVVFIARETTSPTSFVVVFSDGNTLPGYLAVSHRDATFERANIFTFGWVSYMRPPGIYGFFDDMKTSISFTRNRDSMSSVPLTIVNGQLASTQLGSNGYGGIANIRGNFFIGGRADSSRNFLGEIFCVRLYGRELTIEERLSNYNIDKVRFGL